MEISPLSVPGRDPRAIDAYTPSEVAQRVRTAGVEDARRYLMPTLWLAMIGGAMLGLAAAASTAAMAGGSTGYGLTRVVGGLVFGVGLAMVMTGGGELFTSNNLIAMAWASGKVRTREVAVNWFVVYLGNLLGTVSIVVLLAVGGAYGDGGGAVADQAIATAAAKAERSFAQDVALGVLGNALVCLAVWLCFGARTTTDRILACVLPMIALVTLNVDHVVANMHYLAAGLVLRFGLLGTAAGAAATEQAAAITPAAVSVNLVGVTIGNIIGGSGLVAAVYWFVYLRQRPEDPKRARRTQPTDSDRDHADADRDHGTGVQDG